MLTVEQTWGREGAAIEGQEIQLDLSPLSPRGNITFIFGEKSNKHLCFRVLGKSHLRLGKGNKEESSTPGENPGSHHFSKMLGVGFTRNTYNHQAPPDRMH